MWPNPASFRIISVVFKQKYILTPPGFELVVEGENVEHWTTSATTCTVSFRPPDGARCEPMTLKLKVKRATYESPEHKIVIKV